jgi:hypothetical protein
MRRDGRPETDAPVEKDCSFTSDILVPPALN